MGSKKIFFGLDQKLLNKTEVVYPSIKPINNFPKKKSGLVL